MAQGSDRARLLDNMSSVGEVCPFFHVELGDAVLIRKTVGETQCHHSIFHWQIPSQSAFFVTNFYFGDAKFLAYRASCGRARFYQNNNRKNH